MALRSRMEDVANGCPKELQKLKFSNVEINGIADSIEVIVRDIARREKQRETADLTEGAACITN